MKIIIDCFKLIKGNGKSIGIYNFAKKIVHFLSELKNKEEALKDVEIIVIGNKFNSDDMNLDNIKFISVDELNPFNKLHCIIWELIFVNKYIKKYNADKVLFPRGFTSINCPAEDIIIVHDMIPFYYDEYFKGYFNRIENFYIMNRMKWSIKNAKKVITISNESKNDIIKICGIDENKIKVIYNAYYPLEIDKSSLSSKKDYICAITSKMPHKNLDAIIESYKIYCSKANSVLKLKIIGVDNIDEYNLSDSIKRNITCYKYIKSDKDLQKIVGESKLLLFLSMKEGFGLPPIEAMQLGVPVIYFDTSSLPEICGEAGIKVKLNDYDEVANKMIQVINDDEEYNRIVEAGYKNIERFNIELHMKQYIDVIVNGK